MQRIGIFGGSFNPIHNGHIALARRLLEVGHLDEVWLMVSPQNPLKQNAELKPASVRYAIAEKALATSENQLDRSIHVSSFEFSLPTPTYTWSTLQQLRKRFPYEFVLLIGADNWQLFDHWRNYEDIISNYEIIIYPREGYFVDASQLPPTVHLADMQLLPISSTEVRRRVRMGESIAGLVPQKVEKDVLTTYSN
jgi:nicotinate-nucleotide adenylyltransferase